MRKTTRWLLPSLVSLFLIAGFWMDRVRHAPPGAQESATDQVKSVNAAPEVPAANQRVPASRALTPEEIQQARREMKLSLAAVYGGERAFFEQFHRYTTDLLHGIDFIPIHANHVRWSKLGFLRPFSPRELSSAAEDPRFLDTDAYLAPGGRPDFSYEAAANAVNLADWARLCAHGCTANERHFEVLAVSEFRPGFPPEVWSINDRKEIRQLQDGTGEDGR